jgi:hypothetical protein
VAILNQFEKEVYLLGPVNESRSFKKPTFALPAVFDAPQISPRRICWIR